MTSRRQLAIAFGSSLTDQINSTRRVSIVTLEDPIEMLHRDKMAIVSQREVGVDSVNFPDGLRRILRQDPNVVMVSELRDAETIEAALYAAETGHLVLASMYTNDATETVNRLIEVFEPHRHHQMRLRFGRIAPDITKEICRIRANGKKKPAVLGGLRACSYSAMDKRCVKPSCR